MKKMRYVLALVTALAMLLSMAGIAEEPAGATQNPAGMIVPEDEALNWEDGTSEGEAEKVPLALNQSSAILDYSQSVTLITTTGGNEVRWVSSDENVASLSARNGEIVNVVAINEGTATITCTLGEEAQACEVTVKAPETLQITGVDYPATFHNAGWGWKLRNGTVASVDDLATLTTEIKNANGELVGNSYTQKFSEGKKRYEIKGIDNYVPFSRIKEAGTYTWTLTAVDVCGRTASVSLPVTAVAEGDTVVTGNQNAYSSDVVATALALESAGMTVALGETKQLNAVVTPGGAATRMVWQSADPSVAQVSESGEVTGVSLGTTEISCETYRGSGIVASCTVQVVEDLAEITPAAEAFETEAEVSEPDAKASTPEDNDAQNDKVQVDSRNLFFGTEKFDGNCWVGKGDTYTDGDITYRKVYNLWEAYVGQQFTLEPGSYTLSVLARNNAGIPVKLYAQNEPGYSQYAVEISGDQWQRYTIGVFTPSVEQTVMINIFTRDIEIASSAETSIDVALIKFERGDTATDWTPALEDMDG